MYLRPDDSTRRAEGASLDSKITKNPSAAQARHLGRHAAMMSLYYNLRDLWSDRVSNEQNIDYANGRFDSRRQADVKDYLDRHNDQGRFLRHFCKIMDGCSEIQIYGLMRIKDLVKIRPIESLVYVGMIK